MTIASFEWIIQELFKSDRLLGEERDGYVKVTTSRGDGWIKKIMLRKM